MKILKYDEFSKLHDEKEVNENFLQAILDFFRGLFELFSNKKIKKHVKELDEYYDNAKKKSKKKKKHDDHEDHHNPNNNNHEHDEDDEQEDDNEYQSNLEEELDPEIIRTNTTNIFNEIEEELPNIFPSNHTPYMPKADDTELETDTVTKENFDKFFIALEKKITEAFAIFFTTQDAIKLPFMQKIVKSIKAQKSFTIVSEEYASEKEYSKWLDDPKCKIDKDVKAKILQLCKADIKDVPDLIKELSVIFVKLVKKDPGGDIEKDHDYLGAVHSGAHYMFFNILNTTRSLIKNTDDEKLIEIIANELVASNFGEDNLTRKTETSASAENDINKEETNESNSLDDKIVITGCFNGFNSVDFSNEKNKGGGTSFDVRPPRHECIENSDEVEKKWAHGFDAFSYIFKLKDKKYLICAAGLKNAFGIAEGGRYGTIFTSVELTDKTSNTETEETLLKKAIEVYNEKFSKEQEVKKRMEEYGKSSVLEYDDSFLTVFKKKTDPKVLKTQVSFFMANPNKDGSFNESSASKLFKEGASIYAFKKSDDTHAEFWIYKDSAKFAISYPDKMIDPVCNANNAYDANATEITIIKNGKATLEGDKWKVTDSCEIKYGSEDNESKKKVANESAKFLNFKDTIGKVNKATKWFSKVIGSTIRKVTTSDTETESENYFGISEKDGKFYVTEINPNLKEDEKRHYIQQLFKELNPQVYDSHGNLVKKIKDIEIIEPAEIKEDGNHFKIVKKGELKYIIETNENDELKTWYSAKPSKENEFNDILVSKKYIEDKSIYKFIYDENKHTAEFYINDSPESIKLALQSPKENILTVCKSNNIPDYKTRGIKTIKPGVAVRNKDKAMWVVTKKALISFTDK